MMVELLYDAEIWVLIAFVIFVVAFGGRLVKTLTGVLDSRAERVRVELSEARRLREDAAKALEDYKARQAKAAAEAEGLIAKARLDAEEMRRVAEAELEVSLRRRERQALDRIAQMEAQAIAEVRSLAADLAIKASREVLTRGLGIADQDRLVAKVVAEIPKHLN